MRIDFYTRRRHATRRAGVGFHAEVAMRSIHESHQIVCHAIVTECRRHVIGHTSPVQRFITQLFASVDGAGRHYVAIGERDAVLLIAAE